jgi:hypothetical protein
MRRPVFQDHTPPLKLDDSHNNFERGMKDTFAPKAIDVGDIGHIIVRKTGGGLGGDWHLQEIEIWHPGKGLAFARSYCTTSDRPCPDCLSAPQR